MDGDVSHARQSLQEIIQYFHSADAKILGPGGQAHDLFCAYGRLYVLEKRVGHTDDAEVALTRARYWHLQDYELSQDGWKTGVGLHEFLSYQTPDWFQFAMDKLDRGANHGTEPKYVEDLSHTQPNHQRIESTGAREGCP